jgi:hypothetical protein
MFTDSYKQRRDLNTLWDWRSSPLLPVTKTSTVAGGALGYTRHLGLRGRSPKRSKVDRETSMSILSQSKRLKGFGYALGAFHRAWCLVRAGKAFPYGQE